MTRRRPRWLPLAAALAAMSLFAGLGVWQVERAGEKQALVDKLGSDAGAPHTRLPSGTEALRDMAFERIRVAGRFETGRQFLLDNRILDGRTGYDVLVPLRLADGRLVLVDRGWVPAGPGRAPSAPVGLDATGPVVVTGRVWLPESGIGLGQALAPPGTSAWPRTATRVDFEAMGRALGHALAPAVIRASGNAPWILRSRPLSPHFGPRRHYGYALQWFALALTVLIVTLWQSLRRRRERT